ncbi:MAG TPA: maleylpyruvate isomerase N-terminal domain-containing protein [Acidimicrobiales bacterium]|nr:maleylpyruvate isomerase N-terminal domain-containing protein [Acidimicrobiales bacterium]
MTDTSESQLFVAGAGVVLDALSDPAVEAAWDRPSVLEEQLVSSLAGHLARGGIWVVAEYLRAGTAARELDFASAADYFGAAVTAGGPEARKAVRDRGAAIAALGREEIIRRSSAELTWLETELEGLPAGQLIAVIGGKVMTLAEYLATRVVEQAVHLDDLARSVGREPWPLPREHRALAISIGTDIACRAHGPDATIRALYRRGFAEGIFPVL